MSSVLAILSSCSKWTETEPMFQTELTHNKYVDASEFVDGTDPSQINALIRRDAASPYYQKLREWKATMGEREVSYGYFGNHTAVGQTYKNSLRGLPDSTDFCSLWSGWRGLDAARKADIKYVREVKGTKVLAVILLFDIGDAITPDPETEEDKALKPYLWKRRYWGADFKEGDNWTYNDESIKGAITKYASALADSIIANHLDGLDIDAEPHFNQPPEVKNRIQSNLWKRETGVFDNERMNLFLEVLGKKIGPKAETAEGRKMLLCIDGEPQAVDQKNAGYFNYFILQTYEVWQPKGLDFKYADQVKYWTELSPEEVSRRIIYVADFETGASKGGRYFPWNKDNVAGDTQLAGFAKHSNTYDGTVYRKGGIGTFHMEYEYNVSGKNVTYPFLREAIQIQNPAIR